MGAPLSHFRRKVAIFLAGTSAVIFVPDDTAKTGFSRPLMLARIMGSPLLSWLVSALVSRGAGRFFLVCHERFADEARACFPAGVEVMPAADQDAPDLLHVFLSTAEEEEPEVVVVTGPAVLVDRALVPQGDVIPNPSCISHVSREALMQALDEKFSFLDFLRQRGKAFSDRDGAYSVKAPEELAAWQPVLNLTHLHALVRGGAEIWDYQNCYVDPSVRVGRGTVLMPGTILRGATSVGEDCVIGPNAYLENVSVGSGTTVNASQLYDASVGDGVKIGPFAYVRPNTKIASRVKVGDFVELKNSTIGEGTKIAHLTYVGDSDVGSGVNFGCGTVTVNYDRAKKFRTVIEDNAFIGCNTNLVAPVKIGRGAYTAAGSTITDDVPPQALAIARARQTVKRDWAAKNKKK